MTPVDGLWLEDATREGEDATTRGRQEAMAVTQRHAGKARRCHGVSKCRSGHDTDTVRPSIQKSTICTAFLPVSSCPSLPASLRSFIEVLYPSPYVTLCTSDLQERRLVLEASGLVIEKVGQDNTADTTVIDDILGTTYGLRLVVLLVEKLLNVTGLTLYRVLIL